MTKKHILIFIFVLAVLISTIQDTTVQAGSPEQFVVALNEKPSFPNRGRPGTEMSKNPGVAFETLKLIEHEIQIPLVFKRYPYKRCLAYLQHGSVDAVMTASFKIKRRKYGVYPEKNQKPDINRRVYHSSYYLYVQTDSNIKIQGNKLMHLDGPVGAELGFSIIDDLKNRGISVHAFATPDLCFKPLSQNRLKGVAAHETTGRLFVQKYPNIKQLSPPLISKPYYLILSHQFYDAHPQLSEKIWDTIAELRQSTQEWKMLKDKYYSLQTWPEGN